MTVDIGDGVSSQRGQSPHTTEEFGWWLHRIAIKNELAVILKGAAGQTYDLLCPESELVHVQRHMLTSDGVHIAVLA